MVGATLSDWVSFEMGRFVALALSVLALSIAVTEAAIRGAGPMALAYVSLGVVLLLVYFVISAKNLRPRIVAGGFVPVRVSMFRRIGLREPVVRFSEIQVVRMRTTASGVPYCVEVVAGSEMYTFSMTDLFPEERSVALALVQKFGTEEARRVAVG